MESRELKVWAAFLTAAVIWSTSFLWIKVGLQELTPWGLVFYRLVIATISCWILFSQKMRRLQLSWLFFGKLFLLAIVTPLLPFILITWGETQIDSGVASVLNGSVPIFAVLFAAAFLPDEPFTQRKVIGILGGFLGILIIFWEELRALELTGRLLGQMAVVGGAACYGLSTVFTRRWLKEVPPSVQTSLLMTGALILVSLTAGYDSTAHFRLPTQFSTWVAVGWLGTLGTAVSYILYFFVVERWGAGRASMLNYLLPPLGMLWGIGLLHEPFHWCLVWGMVVISLSILLVNRRKRG